MPKLVSPPAVEAIAKFDSLPGTARVGASVVCSLFHVSKATLERRIKAGEIPKPINQGSGHWRTWKVGDIRSALAGKV